MYSPLRNRIATENINNIVTTAKNIKDDTKDLHLIILSGDFSDYLIKIKYDDSADEMSTKK